MPEFKVIENLKPNKDLTNILKNFKYKVKSGQIKTILHTNLQKVLNLDYTFCLFVRKHIEKYIKFDFVKLTLIEKVNEKYKKNSIWCLIFCI